MSAETNDLRQYVRAVLKRWWIIALLVAIGVGAVYWFPTPLSRAGRAPAVYSATATVMIVTPPVTPAPPVTGSGDDSLRATASNIANDMIQLLSSRTISNRVAARLGLREAPSAISAVQIRGTDLIRITAASNRPQRAAETANVAAEELASYFRETNRASMSESRRFIEQQLVDARARLEASERAIQAFQESRNMPSVTAAENAILGAASAIQTEIDASAAALHETEARLAAARERLARERPTMIASQSTSDNPVFRVYQERLTALEVSRATLAQQYTVWHPRMQQLLQEIADIRAKLTAEVRTQIAEEVTTTNPVYTRLVSEIVTLEVSRAAAAARLEALQTTQRRRLAAVASIPAAATEFNRLTRENRILEHNYTTLASRYEDILLRENQAGYYPASLQAIEAAVPPTVPTSSFRTVAAAAGAAGLLFGVIVALFLETIDDGIRGTQDAERVLGVPVLAEIPAVGARTAPAPAVLSIGTLLAVLVLLGAIASRAPNVPAVGRIRSAVASAASWAQRAPAAAVEPVGAVEQQK